MIEAYDALANQGVTLLMRRHGQPPYAGNLEIGDWQYCQPPTREQVIGAYPDYADHLCVRLDTENCVFAIWARESVAVSKVQEICRTDVMLPGAKESWWMLYRVDHWAAMPELTRWQDDSGQYGVVQGREHVVDIDYDKYAPRLGQIAHANLGLMEFIASGREQAELAQGAEQAVAKAARARRRVFDERNAKIVASALDELGYGYRYNEMLMVAQLYVDGEWVAADDLLLSWLVEQVAEEFGYRRGDEVLDFRLGKEELRQYIEAITHRVRRNPYRDWVNGIEWDGVPRLSQFLQKFCGVKDGALTSWLGEYVFTAMGLRALRPGYPLSHVPVFISTSPSAANDFLRALLPERNWFASIQAFGDPGSLHEQLAGCVLGSVEVRDRESPWLPGMLSAGRASVCGVKRSVTSLPVVVTDNSEVACFEWLAPVRLRLALSDELTAVRRQLHAEGFARARLALDDVGLLEMSREVKRELRRAIYVGVTDLELEVAAHIFQRPAYYSLDEVREEMGLGSDVGQRSLAEALRMSGWKRKKARVGDTVRSMWVPVSRERQFRMV